MERIDTILKDMRGAINLAVEPTRKYVKTSNYIYQPDCARFKMVVWYRDGRTRYYYSYDSKSFEKQKITDEFEGLKKLIKLAHTLKDQYKNIIIYANLDPIKTTTGDYNCQVIKWNIAGQMSENKFCNFITEEKNVIFDAKRIQYTNKYKI